MENLKGKTENINLTDYNVIVYIRVSGVWWTNLPEDLVLNNKIIINFL